MRTVQPPHKMPQPNSLHSSLIGRNQAKDDSPLPGYATLASRGVLAVGIVYLVATVLDFSVLWILQRQPTPQWELAGVSQTLEGMPRLLLAIGFLYLALYLAQGPSLLWYRIVAVGLIVYGLLAVVLGGVIITTYFVLVSSVPPESLTIFRSIVAKAVILSGLYAVVGIPVGLLGLRRPRGESSPR